MQQEERTNPFLIKYVPLDGPEPDVLKLTHGTTYVMEGLLPLDTDLTAVAKELGEKQAAAFTQLDTILAKRDAELDSIIKKYKPAVELYELTKKVLNEREKALTDRLKTTTLEQLKGKQERSCMLGRLILKLTKTRQSTKVTDPEKAIAYLKDRCPDAVVQTTSVQVSKLTDKIKGELLKASPEVTGLTHYPGNEDAFSIDLNVKDVQVHDISPKPGECVFDSEGVSHACCICQKPSYGYKNAVGMVKIWLCPEHRNAVPAAVSPGYIALLNPDTLQEYTCE